MAKFYTHYYAALFIIETFATIGVTLFTNFREYIVPIVVPGLPLDHAWQYPLNLAYQMCFVPSSVFYYGYFDFLFVTQVLHVILMTTILSKKIRSIGRLIAPRRHRNRRMDITLNLRNIILLHSELIG